MQLQSKGNNIDKVMCFYGTEGVWKTSTAKSIARALNRKVSITMKPVYQLWNLVTIKVKIFTEQNSLNHCIGGGKR